MAVDSSKLGRHFSSIPRRHVHGLFSRAQYEQAFKRAGLRVRFYKRGLTGRGLLVGTKPLE
jgi:hypothetical protein